MLHVCSTGSTDKEVLSEQVLAKSLLRTTTELLEQDQASRTDIQSVDTSPIRHYDSVGCLRYEMRDKERWHTIHIIRVVNDGFKVTSG
ncbi:uncharacterized protein CANTADRAFT_91683 [Suhomyces tanzawaensis NRRL Y-17324]|uniref:Uncharacterized protein n=1 Tax=Suhomyces tanzawaensis NRRL Y-17324 TaxID=984487 RepID=A0A1E4SCJ3_9ASCO|nr:uncharacterized protein CANTADRAFT_91683 [Suhomyces tanzawaensis NRRL Y-17324]ODV77213.1 hypothetical protein CANTADRAFT_91683 [Suhomyces tanzawaensis NRRL Y-17324]